MSRKLRPHTPAVPREGTLSDETFDPLCEEHMDRLLGLQVLLPHVGAVEPEPGVARRSIVGLMRECEHRRLTCRLVLIGNGHWAILVYDAGNLVRLRFDWADTEEEREHLGEAVRCGAGPRFQISFPRADDAASETSSIICIAELDDDHSGGVPELIPTSADSTAVTAVFPFETYLDTEVTQIYRG